MMLLAQRLEELEQKLLETNSMVNKAAIVQELAHVRDALSEQEKGKRRWLFHWNQMNNKRSATSAQDNTNFKAPTNLCGGKVLKDFEQGDDSIEFLDSCLDMND